MGANIFRSEGCCMTSPFITRVIPQATLLFVLWMGLSGSTNIYHVLLGGICSFGIAWLNFGQPGAAPTPFPPFRFLLYLPWLLSRIVSSALHVTAVILNPKLPINPALIRHRIHLEDHRAVVLLGNSITLTPGTVTAEASPHELLVHALDAGAAADLTSGTFEQKVAAVFARSTRH